MNLWTMTSDDALCGVVVERSSIPIATPFPIPAEEDLKLLGTGFDCLLIDTHGLGRAKYSLLQGSRDVRGDRNGRGECSKKCVQLLHGVERLRTEKRTREEDLKLYPFSLLPDKEREGRFWQSVYGVSEGTSLPT